MDTNNFTSHWYFRPYNRWRNCLYNLSCINKKLKKQIGMLVDKDKLEEELRKILDKNKDKRVVIIGTTCTGKSTLSGKIKNAKDMDAIVFPLFTEEEKNIVRSRPWTPEIGDTMIRLVREKVKVNIGEPMFSTVVLDSDLIVYLKISDKLLNDRVDSGDSDFKDAKNMQKQIEEEIEKSKIPSIQLFIS